MQDLLKLTDVRLARALDDQDKYGETNPVLEAFRSGRDQISRLVWDGFAMGLGCDSGPIAETGVLWRPMEEATARQFLLILQESQAAPLQRQDFVFGHMATLAEPALDYLNSANEYREATPRFIAALGAFLSEVGPEIERNLGHPWRVGSIRQFVLQPGAAGGRHLDGWPPSMRKLFILPSGATRRTGTTWFRMRNGQEMILENEKPIWAIFENSAVTHSLVSSEFARPTIEVDLIPATKTSTEAFYAGNNGWYPWFPTEAALLEATRIAFSLALLNNRPAPLIEPTPSVQQVPPQNSTLLHRLAGPLRRLFP